MQCNNNVNNNNNDTTTTNNSSVFWFFCIYFSLKGEMAVKFGRFNLAFLSRRQGDQLNTMTQAVGLIS